MGGVKRRNRNKKSKSDDTAKDSEQTSANAPAVPLVSDSRFASQHWDPRFGRVPTRESSTTVVPDERFEGLLTKPSFKNATSRADRYGRSRRVGAVESSSSDDEDDVSSSEDDDGLSDDDDVEVLGADEAAAALQAAIPRGSATRRLAVVGLDWSTTRAVDVFAALASFCDSRAALCRVAVHPSKLGLKRLAAEAKLGPAVVSNADRRMLANAPVVEAAAPSDDSDDDDESSSDGDAPGPRDVEREKWRRQQRLRRYEAERLQYFYAVAEFESAGAAENVYDQCDGVEYAQSRRAFDLRFIPDNMKIETSPRESCTGVPDGYKPPNVAPSTLSNSTVKLTWDADAPERIVLKKRAVGRHELDEENLKAYLASASEDEEDAAEVARKRALLLGGGDEAEADEEEEVDKAMELEVKFEPGMLEKGEQIVRAREEKLKLDAETPWEARMRRMKERKAEKRRLYKERDGANDDQTVHENAGEATFDDPFFQDGPSSNKAQRDLKKRKREVEEEEDEETKEQKRRKAEELELLLADDKHHGGLRGTLAQAESDDDDDRMERRKKKRTRGRRRSEKERSLEAKTVKPSALDTKDARFQGVFDSHEFAIDPTHPKFKKNETTLRILDEKHRRLRHAEVQQSAQPVQTPTKKSATAGVMDLAAKIKARNKTRK